MFLDGVMLVSRVKCTYCNDVIQSNDVLDSVTCSCGKVTLTGGVTCRSVEAPTWRYEDYSLYWDTPFEVLRKHLHIEGLGVLCEVPLVMLIKNIHLMEDDQDTECFEYSYLVQEKEYRGFK